MSKININDDIMTVVISLSDGNPGAAQALMTVSSEYSDIDPEAAFKGLTPFLALDTYEIYGTDIYVIYNDKCQRNSTKFALLLRAAQLGIFSVTQLKKLSKDQMYEFNIEEAEWLRIKEEVGKQLKEFNFEGL